MKMRNLALITALACAQCGCSRSVPEYASPKSIKSQFPDQFLRVEYYAKNFTRLINAVPYPAERADEVDERLFRVPSILNVSILNESTSIGMGRDSWSREPLNNRSFWLPPDANKLPRVAIGKGSAGAGKEFDIAEYSDVVIEPETGNKIRITIDFDLAELKKHAEQASGGNGGQAR
ncbi:hypothetical protein JIN85_19695 [Luteolibacter pohnpeiensis]|uniref:Uncharacterized protein n=1 Tax=Luteolibacter pohnpeiensis TaxID=454153 RepID=A0A934SEX9_9BACT|nr:hypothetical protein [Luteolibacter pohnpeiensis]MBK1884649.1 hypothetical protein [Luteolibacter pohnpeiensis]